MKSVLIIALACAALPLYGADAVEITQTDGTCYCYDLKDAATCGDWTLGKSTCEDVDECCEDEAGNKVCCLKAAIKSFVYISATSSRSLFNMATFLYQHAEQSSLTQWTTWLNRDSPAGTGDFETLSDLQKAHGVCTNPIKIECRSGGKPWNEVGQVYQCDTAVGGVCYNAKQRKGESCNNYEVRFLCPR